MFKHSVRDKTLDTIYNKQLHDVADAALEEKAREIDAAFEDKTRSSYFPTHLSSIDVSEIEISEEDRALIKKIAGEVEAEYRNMST